MTGLTKPMARYPHIREVNGLYFLAGQGSRDPDTDECAGLTRAADGRVLAYDIRAQTLGVLENIERALESVGLGRGHLVDVTVFLTSMDDFGAMNEVWNRYFEMVAEAPTRTTVAVSALPGDNFVEMKAVAFRRKANGKGENP